MTTPSKPTDTLYRVFHGGAWFVTTATDVRAAFRSDYTPSFRSSVIGFRCAQLGCRLPLKG